MVKGTKFFFIGSVNDKKYQKNENYKRIITQLSIKDGVIIYVPILKKLEASK